MMNFRLATVLPATLLVAGILCFSCTQKRESADATEVSDSLFAGSPRELPSGGFLNELDDPERDDWQKPGVVIGQFGNLEGKRIADIGAGTGYFTFRLAAAGADVLAIDIDPNFLEHIEEVALEAGANGSVKTRISPPESPSLAANEIDGALIVNTASFLPNRTLYFQEIFAGLSPGGKIVVVDFKPSPSPVSPAENLLISSEKLVSELKAAGFQRVSVDMRSLPYQYMVTAVKP